MSKTQSVNPHNNELLGEYEYISNEDLTKVVEKSWAAYQTYRQVSPKDRAAKLAKLAQVLTDNADRWGKTIALEQGKPLNEAVAEVKKAAGHALYYSKNMEEYVKDEIHNLEFKRAAVEYYPVGPIFFVAPFNFPFWLVFKGAIPAIAMGNTIISKTASVCPQTGLAVQEAFDLAGFNSNEFQYVLTTQDQSELIISHPYVKGVSFTGSTQGGSSIASLAGKYLKKAVMELGGSDPFIVLEDADVDLAVTTALASRLRNGGQVCTCAKRFLVHEKVYDEFRDKLVEKIKGSKVGDPMDADTKVGPLTKPKVVTDIKKQVDEGVKQGAKLLTGGYIPTDEHLTKGNYYLPAVLEVPDEQNILFREETFGPVFPIMKITKDEDFVRIGNDTEYGLGGIVIGKDLERAQAIGRQIDTGALFINAPVSADSRLPSGGTKNSGFGRECGPFGIREFCNIKTVVAK